MKIKSFILFVVPCLILACSDPTPEAVYIKDDLYSQSLTIAVSQKMIVVNEWYVLFAERKTGPWKRVKRSSLSEGQCWIVRPPPQKEDNVANNVTWLSEPDTNIEYSIPQNPFTEPRKVKFKSAGHYRLKAISSSWCGEPFESNTIEIEVISPAAETPHK